MSEVEHDERRYFQIDATKKIHIVREACWQGPMGGFLTSLCGVHASNDEFGPILAVRPPDETYDVVICRSCEQLKQDGAI